MTMASIYRLSTSRRCKPASTPYNVDCIMHRGTGVPPCQAGYRLVKPSQPDCPIPDQSSAKDRRESLGDDIRNQRVLQTRDLVAQPQLALLQSGELQLIARAAFRQGDDGRV